jgi:hypothetical protein
VWAEVEANLFWGVAIAAQLFPKENLIQTWWYG